MATLDQIAQITARTTLAEFAASFPEAMEYIRMVFPMLPISHSRRICQHCAPMTIADFAHRQGEEDPEDLVGRVRAFLMKGYELGPA
ncbi:MAG: hypothetical protein HY475_00130 [Candidatus Terrybacteria bacterium]|nr:hypothetical protein [Candidatus Terrybacteria bacterium]